MKNKFILLATLLFFSIISYSQSPKDPYIPVLGENKVWFTANREEFGHITTTQYYTNITEIINSIEYTRITSENGTLIYAFLREDPDERKVYKYQVGGDKILCDFSLKVGDSIFIEIFAHQWYIVDAINYIDTEVGPRKAWFLSDIGTGELTPVWIEGIGSMAGILIPHQQPNLDWWDFPELLCYENDGVLEFKSVNGTAYGCQLESIGLEELSNPLQVHISPNPVVDKSIISFSNPSHCKTKLQVFDAMGRLINQKTTTTNNFIIEKTDYAPDLYYYQITNKQTIYQSKFIVL